MGEIALIEAIELCLPQTQCGACGHPRCTPYAEAIAAGEPINRCAPGGVRTIEALAALLHRPALPLDPAHGPETPPQVAFVRESACIGCVKCIAACPVDAIVGAARRLHTVIAEHCTGCGLCLPPCPVDCIDLLPRTPPVVVPSGGYLHGTPARLARERWGRRARRLAQARADAQAARAERQAQARRASERAERARRVQEAVERVKAKKLAGAGPHAAAVAAAIDRAQAKTLLRVLRADAPAPAAPAAVTPESLERQRATTRRKLERAAQKRDEVQAEGDAALLERVLEAERELRRRLARIEAALAALAPAATVPGTEAAP